MAAATSHLAPCGLVEGTGLQAAALISRAVVVPALAGWLAALDGVAARLEAGGEVADVGCGYGAPTSAPAVSCRTTRYRCW